MTFFFMFFGFFLMVAIAITITELLGKHFKWQIEKRWFISLCLCVLLLPLWGSSLDWFDKTYNNYEFFHPKKSCQHTCNEHQ